MADQLRDNMLVWFSGASPSWRCRPFLRGLGALRLLALPLAGGRAGRDRMSDVIEARELTEEADESCDEGG